MKLYKTLKVPNELGLHARAASKIAKLAEGAKATVFIAKDGEEADAEGGERITINTKKPHKVAFI